MDNPPMPNNNNHISFSSFKPEPLSPTQHSGPQPAFKTEPHDLPIIVQSQPQHHGNDPSKLLESIDGLANLSAAINAFKSKFDELQKHLDFIATAIEARSKILAFRPSNDEEQRKEQPQTEALLERENPTETDIPATSNPEKSELLVLCETMLGRGLRRYITAHLSNVPKLREEVPLALKRSPNPAKLVLDCIGRFFLQGSKAYTNKDSPMVTGREACVLVLEFLLLIDGKVKVEGAVSHEAEQAAIGWKKRLVAEGGLGRATEIDARGLLLLVSGYGIPNGFKNDDVWDLVVSCNSREIAPALRRSRALVSRISDIIEGRMKSGMKIEAVDIASILGIDDRFPPRKLLTSFLRDKEEWLKRKRKEVNHSLFLLKEVNEKHLSALKSVIKFLKDRKMDVEEVLPEVELKAMKLEKDISDHAKQIDDWKMQKRKAEESELSRNLMNQETKRPRFSEKRSTMISAPVVGLHEQRAAVHVEDLYNGSLRTNLLDGGFSGHVNSYSYATTVPNVSDTGYLPENVLGTMTGGPVYANGVGLQGVYDVSSAGSFPGVHRETLIDRDGQRVVNHAQSYGWTEIENTPFNERSIRQGFIRQPVSGLHEASPSVDGFLVPPNSTVTAASSRSSAYDLYRYAKATNSNVI
ncbi:hypothetical protein K2173_027583 [Erythroxylum novogranatense]|uniref:FRIGIDA-like protein n=1 Tax=Erythroxylum novogranatense TaxID=1862640 RepID=A0AAV8TZG6_9ROSI|nr:hypothetical protein K2173_027583 [Erythroxylum novogranatense]